MFLVDRSLLNYDKGYVVFDIHYDGCFITFPNLKYENGKIMTVHVCKSKRMNYEDLLDMLSDKLE